MTKAKHYISIAVLSLLTIVLSSLGSNANATDETHRNNYTLMPGVTESTIYATDNSGKNLRIHALWIDHNANVSLKASFKSYYKKGSTAKSRKKSVKNLAANKGKMLKASTQAANFNKSKDVPGTVVAGINGDHYYIPSTNKSKVGMNVGNLIAEGNVIHKAKTEYYFAVMKNGSYQIREPRSSIKNVSEAVAGQLLVRDNNIVGAKDERNPRIGIGITTNSDLLILNVDGRHPTTSGVSKYMMARLFQQLGCNNAIGFDGGGSASFLTKRSNNKSVKFRNIPGDGFIRNVPSSLLVVKNKNNKNNTANKSACPSMVNSKTKISKNDSGVYTYLFKGKKQTGFHIINGKTYLFNNNGNGMTKTIKIGKHKYKFTKGALTKCSDKRAGTVYIGYCGASKGGKNLLYAYHTKSMTMNVGLNPLVKKNGKMRNWPVSYYDMPWYTIRHKIKVLTIGNGVKNIGTNFVYMPVGKIFDGSKMPTSKLKKVTLPKTLVTIGKLSFHNHRRIKNLSIPAGVKKIGQGAFKYSCNGYIRFTSKKPPIFGKASLANTYCKRIFVKRTSSWKKFVDKHRARKYGFKKSVNYR